jgi:hypothetical protein
VEEQQHASVRSVVSVLLREQGDFLYTLKAALRAASGRPRPGDDTSVTGTDLTLARVSQESAARIR